MKRVFYLILILLTGCSGKTTVGTTAVGQTVALPTTTTTTRTTTTQTTTTQPIATRTSTSTTSSRTTSTQITTTTLPTPGASPCGMSVCLSTQPGAVVSAGPGTGIPWAGLCANTSILAWDWIGVPGTNEGMFVGNPQNFNTCLTSSNDKYNGGGVVFQRVDSPMFYSHLLYDQGLLNANWGGEGGRSNVSFVQRVQTPDLRMIASGRSIASLTLAYVAPIVYKPIRLSNGSDYPGATHTLEPCMDRTNPMNCDSQPRNNMVFSVGNKVMSITIDPVSGDSYNRVFQYNPSADFYNGFSLLARFDKRNPNTGKYNPQIYPLSVVQDHILALEIVSYGNGTATVRDHVVLNSYKLQDQPLMFVKEQTLFDFATIASNYGIAGLAEGGVVVSKNPDENYFSVCTPDAKCSVYQIANGQIILYQSLNTAPLANCQGRTLRLNMPVMVDYCASQDSQTLKISKNGVVQAMPTLPLVGSIQGGNNNSYCIIGHYAGAGVCERLPNTYYPPILGIRNVGVSPTNDIGMEVSFGITFHLKIY